MRVAYARKAHGACGCINHVFSIIAEIQVLGSDCLVRPGGHLLAYRSTLRCACILGWVCCRLGGPSIRASADGIWRVLAHSGCWRYRNSRLPALALTLPQARCLPSFTDCLSSSFSISDTIRSAAASQEYTGDSRSCSKSGCRTTRSLVSASLVLCLLSTGLLQMGTKGLVGSI